SDFGLMLRSDLAFSKGRLEEAAAIASKAGWELFYEYSDMILPLDRTIAAQAAERVGRDADALPWLDAIGDPGIETVRFQTRAWASSSRNTAAPASPTWARSSASPSGWRARARSATRWSSWSARWAIPPTSCSGLRARSRTIRIAASWTCCSPPASGFRWRS